MHFGTIVEGSWRGGGEGGSLGVLQALSLLERERERKGGGGGWEL